MISIVPSFIILTPALQVLLQYVCITRHQSIPMPVFFIFPLVWTNVIGNNILVFTLASWVNNVSIKILKKNEKAMVHKACSRRRSALMKEVKASTVLKIKFGSNFIDSRKPLVIQNFSFSQTMSLILISSSKKGH